MEWLRICPADCSAYRRNRNRVNKRVFFFFFFTNKRICKGVKLLITSILTILHSLADLGDCVKGSFCRWLGNGGSWTELIDDCGSPFVHIMISTHRPHAVSPSMIPNSCEKNWNTTLSLLDVESPSVKTLKILMMHCISGRCLCDTIYRGNDGGTDRVNIALEIQPSAPVLIAEG